MTRLSVIPELTHANDNEWKDDMMLTLADMGADAIVIGSDPEPQSLDFDNFDNYDDWKNTEAEAVSMLRLSFSPTLQCIFRGITNPQEMWNKLETRLDRAGSYIGSQAVLLLYCTYQPRQGEPRTTYFTKLSNHHMPLDHMDNEITDCNFHMQLITSLQSQYVMILMVLNYRRPSPTPDEAMQDHPEHQTTATIMKGPGDVFMQATLHF